MQTHLRLFKSIWRSEFSSGEVGWREEDAEQLSSLLRHPSSLHPSFPSFLFQLFKSLTCFYLFPPLLPPSSNLPISLPCSLFSPQSNPPSSLLLSFLLPFPLLYPTSLTFPLTSLPFSLSFLPFLSLPPSSSPPFMKCGWWLAGSCWLGSGGGYSFIIPPRLPARLATMSQELNICHYYLLVLFDFEAAQWPVSAGFILPPSVVRFKVDYSNPRARDSAKSWSFLSFARSFFFPLSCSPLHPPKWNYIHPLAQSITNVHTLTGVRAHIHAAAFCRQWRSGPVLPLLCAESGAVCVWLKTTHFSWFLSFLSSWISHFMHRLRSYSGAHKFIVYLTSLADSLIHKVLQ